MRTFLFLCLLCTAAFYPACAQRPQVSTKRPQVPTNGPKATVIQITNLYISADTSSQRLTQVAPGREMVILERNGPWLNVFANTDIEASRSQDAPVFSSQASVTPTSGWVEAKGVVAPSTPQGDRILFGVAATDEAEASEPHAPEGTAQAARALYQRVVDFYPQSPLAPEAAWRTADIRWQLQKADVFSLPSAHEQDPDLREQIDETEMRDLEKRYPNSKWADLAAWDMLDNKVCGSWEGSTKCPEKEATMYENYAREHPDSPKAPEALYDAAYRQGVLNDMYSSNGDKKKAGEAKANAIAISGFLASKYPQSDYTARAAALVYKLEAEIPIYGIDQE